MINITQKALVIISMLAFVASACMPTPETPTAPAEEMTEEPTEEGKVIDLYVFKKGSKSVCSIRGEALRKKLDHDFSALC